MNRSKTDAVAASSVSRRSFTTGALGAVATATLLRQRLWAAAPQGRHVIHLIGHSHVDAAWLWPWTDAADLVLTTFRSALDRMNETPGFRYTHSSAVHYRWVEQADPAMFQEVRQRIAEGRWEVVGGWPVEPDCNIPSTESFARQSLYGKQYLKTTLGVNVDIGFNPDSFGHAAGLPSILKHAGYKYYIFMRPQENEMSLPRMFWWEGPDGSRILTYRIYKYYDWTADGISEAAQNVVPQGFNDGMFFLGVGDHGGAATKAQIREIVALQGDQSLPELRWSTVHQFMAAAEVSPAMKDLPVVRGDLQHHARGCYSACGEVKADNRRAEHQLFRAEATSVVSSTAYGLAYPTVQYAEAWEHVLFNQFHDILAGSALFADYSAARDGLGSACQTALEKRHSQLIAMAKQVDLSEAREGAIFAFNPLPWERNALVEFHYQTNETNDRYASLKQKDGHKIALQSRPSDSMTNFYPRLSAWVKLPPCGYKVFTLERDPPPAALPYLSNFTIARSSFGLSSLRSDDGAELLAGPLGLVVIEDKSDTWAHDVPAFRKEIGRPTFVAAELVEDGPVTRVTRQHLTWRNSTITLEIAEFTASEAVELRFVVDWNEHEQVLKLEVPTRLASPKLFVKVPGGVLERAMTGNEEPYQDWVALEGGLNGGPHTVALVNAQTYSYDCLDGLLRTILVRSAPYARHNPNKVQDNGINAWQDQGRQERTFWLLGGRGNYTSLFLDRRATELQTPAEYVLDSRHGGSKSWERSFLEVGPPHVEVLAIKQAEDGRSTIVRLQERSGKASTAHVRSAAMKVDADVAMFPWEIKTVAISAAGQVSTVSIMEV